MVGAGKHAYGIGGQIFLKDFRHSFMGALFNALGAGDDDGVRPHRQAAQPLRHGTHGYGRHHHYDEFRILHLVQIACGVDVGSQGRGRLGQDRAAPRFRKLPGLRFFRRPQDDFTFPGGQNHGQGRTPGTGANDCYFM